MAALTRLARVVVWFRTASRPETTFVGVLTLAALLRLLRLDFQPLWWDEGYSVWFATHPLAEIVALTAQDIHPPLYYALLHGWIGLLGAGSVSLRLLSVLFGVAAIPAIHWAGRRLRGPRAGLLAALLLAINPLHIYYSQEVRMYGLVALLSIGVVAAGWQIANSKLANQQISKSANRQISKSASQQVTPSLIAYILFTTAALYTQYYAVFLPIGLTIYVGWRCFRPTAPVEHAGRLWSQAQRGSVPPGRWSQTARPGVSDAGGKRANCDLLSLTRWLIAQAAVALLYLPWVLYAAPKLTLYVSQKVVQDADRPLGLLEYAARHLAAFLVGHLSGPLATYWPLALLLLLPFGLGWGRLLRRPEDVTPPNPSDHPPATVSPRHRVTPSPCHLVTVVTLTALALGWLIGLRYPFFPEHGERLLLLALPAFILLLATGLDALWSHGEVELIQSAERRRPERRPRRLWPQSKGAGAPRTLRVAAIAAFALIVAASVASLVAFYTVPRYPGDDYRPLIARTVEQGLPEDTVFAVYPWQAGYWRSYGRADGPTVALTPDADWTPAVAAALDDALARGKVWFPAHLALGAILETRIEAHLAGRGVPFINEWYGPSTRLSGWAVTAPPRPVDAPAVRFLLRGADGAAELIGVDASPEPIPAANAVTPITLRWRVPAGAPILAVSVRLVDSIGRIWTQHDYEPLGIADCRLQIANRKSQIRSRTVWVC